jgi:hypothetical protein
MTIVATAPMAIPCRSRFSDSPVNIEGSSMAFIFLAGKREFLAYRATIHLY